MSNDPVLTVDGLTVGYRSGRPEPSALAGRVLPVVHDVSFEVRPGQVLALVGESGSGKTTTGHAILGLLPENGEVIGGRIGFAGRDLTELSPKGWRTVRGSAISLIPQDPTVSLDPLRRVGHQVEDVLRLHTDLDAATRRERVYELFRIVGFDEVERRYRQYPHQLSGGMRQRVLIAAAVASEPDLIIADEPTSGLDATVQKQVLDLIDELRDRLNTAVVLVTHDLGVAADRADTLAVMRHGRIVEIGPTARVVEAPQHEYTRELLDSVPARAAARNRFGHRIDSAAAPVIEVTGLRKVYGSAPPAVDGISFAVQPGSTFAIVGESGSGKSTTARVLTGLTEATEGRVSLFGTDVTGLSRKQFRPLRRRVQFVYQNPYASFDPRFDVFDVVEEPLRAFATGVALPRRQRARHRDQVIAALEAAALPAEFADRHPRELSGGQRQRVAIARALVADPEVLVLDEPISALDVSVAAQIIALLQRLQAERGLTYVFISHDLAVVEAFADRVAVMSRGRIVEQGPTAEVFAYPRQEYTRRLLDAVAGRELARNGVFA
ncbi:ABC transporter ATP-binding protein [Gordonia caeni]|uniref:ABC transporter ATP-binding protein n=1 Tax=Gordonia caeni TaxID=1007097 RepID=A0ABP7PQ08_9ACTN